MKKLILAFMCVGMLAGCANMPRLDTQGPNPVTPGMLFEIENGMTVAVAGLVSYKRLCIAKKLDQICRQQVRQMQAYTAQAKPLLVSLRKFVMNNDQISALTVYRAISDLLKTINVQRAVAGMN